MPPLRAAVVLPLLWSTALAQCDLLPMAGDPVPHATGTVNAIVNWDPDGAGPQAQVQVFAGRFSAGTLTNVSIAFHDGTAWQPLGTPPGVSCTAMTVWNGQLVVAASTNILNSSRLSTWNGTSWVPVGGFGTVSGFVRCFATFHCLNRAASRCECQRPGAGGDRRGHASARPLGASRPLASVWTRCSISASA